MWVDMKKAARVLNSVVYDEASSLAPVFQGYFVWQCVIELFVGEGAANESGRKALQQVLYQSTTYNHWVNIAAHGGLAIFARKRGDRQDVIGYMTSK
jgi:hypothetical protein